MGIHVKICLISLFSHFQVFKYDLIVYTVAIVYTLVYDRARRLLCCCCSNCCFTHLSCHVIVR